MGLARQSLGTWRVGPAFSELYKYPPPKSRRRTNDLLLSLSLPTLSLSSQLDSSSYYIYIQREREREGWIWRGLRWWRSLVSYSAALFHAFEVRASLQPLRRRLLAMVRR